MRKSIVLFIAGLLLATGFSTAASATEWSGNSSVFAYSLNPKCAANGSTIFRVRVVNQTNRFRAFDASYFIGGGAAGEESVGLPAHSAANFRFVVKSGKRVSFTVRYRDEVLVSGNRAALWCGFR